MTRKSYLTLAICAILGVVVVLNIPTRPAMARGAGFFFRDGYSGFFRYEGRTIKNVVVFDRAMDIGVGETLSSSQEGFVYHCARSGQSIEVADVNDHELSICGRCSIYARVGSSVVEFATGNAKHSESSRFDNEMGDTTQEDDEIESFIVAGLIETARWNAELLSMKVEPRLEQ